MADSSNVLLLLPRKEQEKEEIYREKIIADSDVDPTFAYRPEEVSHPENYEVVVSFFYPWFYELLPRMKNLRWIHFLSAGVDTLWEWGLQDRNMIFSNSSGVHAGPISDHVLGQVLYFSRRLGTFTRQQQQKNWQRHGLEELEDQVLGILGLGAIGRACARKARAMGMRVLGSASGPRPVEGVEEVGGPEIMPRILAESDYLVIALPLTSRTRGLLGQEELQLMKRNAVLINIARGEIIDEEALIECLQQGNIKGAGLDVFAREPLPSDSPLWDMENVFITPHVAGSTPRYMERALAIFLENWKAYREGRTLPQQVDLEKGY